MTAKFKTTSRPGADRYLVSVTAGAFVFEEGDLGTEMYIIQEGKVEILQKVGGENRQRAVLEKGDFFGEMSLLEDLPRNASARAMSEVRLLKIDGTTFDQMLRDNPEIGVRMMRKLSRRLREADRLLREAGAEASAAAPEPTAPGEEQPASPAAERLVHERSGMEFPLSSFAETMVGRRDPVTGIFPDIDLSPVDTQRSVSRRHGKVYRRGGKLYLAEEIGTMNGTFVNGNRLVKGVPAEVAEGDELRFGVVGLTLSMGGGGEG
jgi:CRP-like cAMP-binding protein